MSHENTKAWLQAFELQQAAGKAFDSFSTVVLGALHGAEHRRLDLAEKVRKEAESALFTGNTWPEVDKMALMREALENIVQLCVAEEQEQ